MGKYNLFEIKKLNKSYHKREILQNIDFSIQKGEILGIVGKSGAGKSTFLRCLNMLERPTNGEIFFEKTKITSLLNRNLAMYRRNLGMIFQQFNLFEQRTVLGNVSFSLEILGVKNKTDRTKRAIEAIEMVGISDKANEYPSKLSGGQKQRTAIARAIVGNPKVLLCDEATSALDPDTTIEIIELLKTINKKFSMTVVVVSHEMQVIEKLCTRCCVMESGTLRTFDNI